MRARPATVLFLPAFLAAASWPTSSGACGAGGPARPPPGATRHQVHRDVDERVAGLEGRVNEQSQTIDGIRDALVSLEQRMDRRFEGIDRRFESLEQRLNMLDQRMDAGFAAMNQKMDTGFAAQDHRFAWLVGMSAHDDGGGGRHPDHGAPRALTRMRGVSAPGVSASRRHRGVVRMDSDRLQCGDEQGDIRQGDTCRPTAC